MAQTKEYGAKDYQTIAAYAAEQGLEGEMMPWDFGYYSEKYKNEKYAVSDELVKPYLQLDAVREAIFMLANRLYGISFSPAENIAVYHPDVTAY